MIALWLTLVLGAFAAGAGATAFSRAARTRRMMANAPVTAIGALGEDTIGRVIGVVRPLPDRAVLRAPLTGRPCVYYIAVVDQQHAMGRWTSTLIREVASVPFELVDASGSALVDPTHAEVVLAFDDDNLSRTFDEVSPTLEAFLAAHASSAHDKDLIYREAVIAPGERISIYGSGVREPDRDSTATRGGDAYRAGPPTRLRLTGSAKWKLVITADTAQK